MRRRWMVLLLVILFSVSVIGCEKKYETSCISELDEKVTQKEKMAAEDGTQNSDLLYREYTIGVSMGSGNILIESSNIDNLTKSAQSIVIFYNDSVKEVIPYENKNFEYRITSIGYYGFFALDEDNKLVDINDQVCSIHEADEDGIIPLNELSVTVE